MSKASKNTSHRKLFTVSSDAPFQFVEAYKSLRTNLEFLSSAGNCKTILITSSVPEEGKTNVAVNLAMTIAASGKRVVLVDCDLRKATISRYLRIPRNRTSSPPRMKARWPRRLSASRIPASRSWPPVRFRRTPPSCSPPP